MKGGVVRCEKCGCDHKMVMCPCCDHVNISIAIFKRFKK